MVSFVAFSSLHISSIRLHDHIQLALPLSLQTNCDICQNHTEYISACRYEEGYDLDDSLGWMREEWEGAEGSAREEGHARWLLALKTAVRQAFQVRRLLTATPPMCTSRVTL